MTAATSPDAARPLTFHRLALLFLLLMIASLPFMSAAVQLGRYFTTPTDLLYLAALACTAAAVLRGEIGLRWHPFYAVLAVYFGAMAFSALFSAQPGRSAFKLVTQAYLLSLPILAHMLVRDAATLKRAILAWMWTGGMIGAIGLLTLALWLVDPDNALLVHTLHPKGTLAEGNYPRIDVTFNHAAMLGNYLTVAIGLLLIAQLMGWVRGPLFAALLAAMVISAFFSLTPGLAGLWLGVGLWCWLRLRAEAPRTAWLALLAGAAAAAPFLVAAAITPFIHPTAPFLIELPGLGTFAPAARLLFWIDGWNNLLAHLPFGKGIGTDAIAVTFQNPAGHRYTLSDAHNVYLNLGVQTGLPGLLTLALLIGFVARRVPFPRALAQRDAVRIGLGLAWLNAFAFQGLVGSFEDARFLWLLLGLFLASLAWSGEREEAS